MGRRTRNGRDGILVMAFAMLLAGCTSVGHLGFVTTQRADNARPLRATTEFHELGPVRAKACRHFLVGLVPFGNSTLPKAVDKALKERGGDALMNVTVSTSLYGFAPIYNIYSFTCTEVQGVAVKLDELAS